MSRILFAWELGGNFGHVTMLLTLARLLRQRGHTLLFAIRDTVAAARLLATQQYEYVPAPRPAVGSRRLPRPVGFADILSGAGFGDRSLLVALTDAWHQRFNSFQTDILVAQYAPVAGFSARLTGLPCLQFGTGFEIPPGRHPYPCFRPDRRPTRAQLLASENALLKSINFVNACHGQALQHNLQAAMAGDLDLLVTFPELDHYRRGTQGRFIGPILHLDASVTLTWTGKRPRIFVYLRPFAGIEVLLDTLARCKGDVIACIPGLGDHPALASINGLIRISSDLLRLADLLPEMDLLICHANHGVLAAALLAGVPMLMLPTTIEQWMLSARMVELGAGACLRRDRVVTDFSGALTAMLTNSSYRQAAQGLARTYAGYDHNRTVERLVTTIERLPHWRMERRRN